MAEDQTERAFIPLNIAVLTVSDSRTEADDRSGKRLATLLKQQGHRLFKKRIVPDDLYQIRAAVSAWVADEKVQIILTTGGTGVTGRDGTPEAVKALFDKTIDGFGETFRAISYAKIKTSTLQSRAIAGVANGTYIFCLPGAISACEGAWNELIAAQLNYQTRPCNLVELLPRLRES